MGSLLSKRRRVLPAIEMIHAQTQTDTTLEELFFSDCALDSDSDSDSDARPVDFLTRLLQKKPATTMGSMDAVEEMTEKLRILTVRRDEGMGRQTTNIEKSLYTQSGASSLVKYLFNVEGERSYLHNATTPKFVEEWKYQALSTGLKALFNFTESNPSVTRIDDSNDADFRFAHAMILNMLKSEIRSLERSFALDDIRFKVDLHRKTEEFVQLACRDLMMNSLKMGTYSERGYRKLNALLLSEYCQDEMVEMLAGEIRPVGSHVEEKLAFHVKFNSSAPVTAATTTPTPSPSDFPGAQPPFATSAFSLSINYSKSTPSSPRGKR